MLDFSFAELMVIVVGAVLFLRPADVPVVLKAIMKAVRSIRHFWEEIKREVLNAIEEDDTIKTIKQEVGGGKRFILDDAGNYREVYDVSEILELTKGDATPSVTPDEGVKP